MLSYLFFLFVVTYGNAARSYYDVLGIREGATETTIKQSYRNLAKKYHPDKNKGNTVAQDKFIEISNAYETLSDDKKRKEYDHELKFGDVRNFGQHTNNQRQQHQQYPPDDEYIIFQMPDGRIFRQRRGPPQHPFRSHHQQQQQQQQHHQQGGFHFHFHQQQQQQQSFFQFDFDNIDDYWDRQRTPGLWGSIVFYFRYFLHMVLLLMYLMFIFVMGLYQVSPLAVIFLMVGLVMCCIPNRWVNDEEPIRSRSSTPIPPPPPPPPPATLNQLRETDLASKNCICVIALTPKASRHLLVLQNRYRKDPMRFCASLITDNVNVGYDVIATSKGGERWTGLTFETFHETQLTGAAKAINLRDSTDFWLLNLLGGTVSWKITSDNPLPITAVNSSSPRT